MQGGLGACEELGARLGGGCVGFRPRRKQLTLRFSDIGSVSERVARHGLSVTVGCMQVAG